MSDSDTSAPAYTHGHHDSVLRSHRWRTVENSAAYLSGSLRPGLDLLDVGCGPGTLTADLAVRVAPGRVVGTDTSGEVCAEARRAVGALPGVTIVQDDLMHSILPPASFDVVHAHQVLQHVPDPVGALRAMAGLAKPAGLLAARDADYGSMRWWPHGPEFDSYVELMMAVTAANGGAADAGRRLWSWALEADIGEVTASASTWCFSTAAERRWWGDLWADRLTAGALPAHAARLGLAEDRSLEAMAAAWRTWASADTGWFAMTHGEVLVRC